MKKPTPASSSASGDDFRLVRCVKKLNLRLGIILLILIILLSFYFKKLLNKEM